MNSVGSRPAQCYSKKVFIGGIPAGTTQGNLVILFIFTELYFCRNFTFKLC